MHTEFALIIDTPTNSFADSLKPQDPPSNSVGQKWEFLASHFDL